MKTLSEREQELYDLIVLDGLNLKEAAKAMFIEMTTAKKHLHHIFLKKQCASQRELIHRHYKELQNAYEINQPIGKIDVQERYLYN